MTRSERFSTAAGLVLLALCSVLIRIPFLSVPMISDEGGYAYVAHFWARGYELYRDIPFDRPQGIFLIYQLIQHTFGEDVAAIRLAAAFYNAATVVVIWFIAKEMFGKPAAWAAGAFFALFSASPHLEGFTANAELFAMLPLSIAALLTWRRQWVWAGFAAGIAVLMKPIGVSGLLLGVGWALATGASWRGALGVAAGFAVGPAASMIHGVMVGWEYYWASFVDRRLLAYSVVATGFGTQLDRLADGVMRTMPALALPALLGGLGWLHSGARARLFAVLWVVSSWAGMSIGGNWFWHYFLQLVPPLAVMAGAGAVALPHLERPRAWGVVLGAALALFIHVEMPLFIQAPNQISWSLYQRPAYVQSEQIAAYINRRTPEGEPIQVAFSEAELYYLARRPAAAPQLYWAEVYHSRHIFQQVMASIEGREPALVVLTRHPPETWITYGEFYRRLNRHYEVDARFGNIWIYRRRSG